MKGFPGAPSSKLMPPANRACHLPALLANILPAMPDAAIHTHGTTLEQTGGILYRVALPNGKIILAHLSKRLASENAVFSQGDLLLLEMTPYDFDTARILGPAA